MLLISRNRRFLIGEEVEGPIHDAVLANLVEQPEIERVTYLRMEFLGPRQVFMMASVDLAGNEPECNSAATLRALRARIETGHPQVRKAFLSLATPDEVSLATGD